MMDLVGVVLVVRVVEDRDEGGGIRIVGVDGRGVRVAGEGVDGMDLVGRLGWVMIGNGGCLGDLVGIEIGEDDGRPDSVQYLGYQVQIQSIC